MFESIQRQHFEILKLTQDMLLYNSIPKVTEDAFQISLLLGTLAGKLSIHLSGEDQCIYPYLMNKPDEKIQATSRQFAAEMGSLVSLFNEYKTQYLSDTNIKNAPADFIQETQKLMEAITARIEKEEEFLYPLISF